MRNIPFRRAVAHIAGALTVVAWIAVPGAMAQSGRTDYEAIGDSLRSAFENQAALDAYRTAISRSGPTYGLLIDLATAANDVAADAEAAGDTDYAQIMYDEARSYSEQLTELYPDSAASWFMHAATIGKTAQFRGGKEKVRIGREVEEFYQRSIALDSTYALAYLVGGIFNREVAGLSWVQRLLANTLFGQVPDGSLEQSARLLRKSIALQRDLLTAHWELAQTYFAMERTDEALAHVRYISQLTPRNSEEQRLKRKAAELLQRETS